MRLLHLLTTKVCIHFANKCYFCFRCYGLCTELCHTLREHSNVIWCKLSGLI